MAQRLTRSELARRLVGLPRDQQQRALPLLQKIYGPPAPFLPAHDAGCTILDVMAAPEWFGPWFQEATWTAWKAFLAALFGLPMDAAAAAIYRQYTGRETVPTEPPREAWVVAGVRAGKSRIAALIAVFLACFRDYRPYLAPGERAIVMVLASDRRQAQVIMEYVRAFLKIPRLEPFIEKQTREAIWLRNRVKIEIHTSSFRSVRGHTCAAVICDEIAFWPTDASGANPDVEILNALRPRMVTIRGALLLCISSPYARLGALWEAHHQHYGRDGDPVLVWHADTQSMNPNVSAALIADAYERDPAVAEAEYGAQFRRDVESFVPREAVEACVIPDRRELLPMAHTRYHAFVDPSGGTGDSMTLAIAHSVGEMRVLDCVRECHAPFNPEEEVQDLVAVLKRFRCHSVTGDHYAARWPRDCFQAYGITYVTATLTRSQLYGELLPLLNSRLVELLDHPRLVAQLCGLERRTTRAGRDSIDHRRNAHDDLSNAAAGALVTAPTASAGQLVLAALPLPRRNGDYIPTALPPMRRRRWY